YGSVLQKFHETGEFDRDEIYPYRIEGLGKNLIPDATDFNAIDRYVKVSDADSAHMARKVAKTEGIFGGYTTGAAVQAIYQLDMEGEFTEDSNVVVVFPDHGSRYMSKVYSNEWMENQGFLDLQNNDVTKKIEYVK
ncbi:MAG: pyridoxal-phosphate dependent enzyme, partial [Bacteroidota bacterium]